MNQPSLATHNARRGAEEQERADQERSEQYGKKQDYAAQEARAYAFPPVAEKLGLNEYKTNCRDAKTGSGRNVNLQNGGVICKGD